MEWTVKSSDLQLRHRFERLKTGLFVQMKCRTNSLKTVIHVRVQHFVAHSNFLLLQTNKPSKIRDVIANIRYQRFHI
jgi:hypothetical protein